MTITWLEIGARWPDACVYWDRDVAPMLDWEPRFEDCHGHLWARDSDCEERGYRRCRCLLWEGDHWATVAHYPDGWTQQWRSTQALDVANRDRISPRSDMADAIAYAADHMWRTGAGQREYRRMERGRWPTLYRVLGASRPRTPDSDK